MSEPKPEGNKREVTPRVHAAALETRDLRELADAYKQQLARSQRDNKRLRDTLSTAFAYLNRRSMGGTVPDADWEWLRIECRKVLREDAGGDRNV